MIRAEDEIFMVVFCTRFAGRASFWGRLCEFRYRLSGWPDGIKFWVMDYRVVTHIGWLWDSRTQWMRLNSSEETEARAAISKLGGAQ